MQAYEEALPAGDEALAAIIVKAFEHGPSEAASRRLAHYVSDLVLNLQAQDLAGLKSGEVRFPVAEPGQELGGES